MEIKLIDYTGSNSTKRSPEVYAAGIVIKALETKTKENPTDLDTLYAMAILLGKIEKVEDYL